MEELMIVANVAIVFCVVYKLFELIICRKERIMLIEKLPAESFANGKMKEGLNLSSVSLFSSMNKFISLRFGALFIGIGLGLILGYFISSVSFPDLYYSNNIHSRMVVRDTVSIIYGSCVLFGGGFGLIVSFLVEMNIATKKRSVDTTERDVVDVADNAIKTSDNDNNK